MDYIYFDNKLNSKLKKQLKTKKIKKQLISNNKFDENFLANYYTPIYTIIKQLNINLKNKSILEIGAQQPYFMNFLISKGANVKGIDINPIVNNKNIINYSVEKELFKLFSKKFDIIYQRLTLSKLYDENYYLKYNKYRYKNKDKILENISKIITKNGYLILLDDRGSIFTPYLFKKYRLKKIFLEYPVFLKNKQGNYGWNVISVYKKI